ncbi:type IV secretion system protein VirB3 [Brucella abortus]|uniref:type IV secretion system protein VirB3 n=1 Tax=Brucella abortus TaxID=235 RepID=UPI0031FBB7C1
MTTAPQESNARSAGYRGDPIFKGCTRPAMLFGVPVIPLVIVGGSIVLLSVWISMFILPLIVPIVLVMRQIAQTDDQMFRLLGLKAQFRLIHFNRTGRFWRASAYSPIAFTKRKRES